MPSVASAVLNHAISCVEENFSTIIQFENFKVNQQVQDEFFTTRSMEREP